MGDRLTPHEIRVRELLALGDKLRAVPLWEIPPGDRRAWLSARERLRYARWVPTDVEPVYKPSDAHERVTDFTATDPD